MTKSINFKTGEIVKFSKKTRVYDLENKTEFFIPKGTTARVMLDQDAGAAGSCKIRLKKEDGSVVVAECDDQNLKIVK